MDEAADVNGGLQIPRHLGVGETVETEIHSRWVTLPSVLEQLDEWRIPSPVEPNIECPVVTAELLQTPDVREYSAMYANQRLWFAYGARKLARIVADLLETQNELKDLGITVRHEYRKKNEERSKTVRFTVSEIDDVLQSTPRHRDLRIREQYLTQFKIELSAWVADLDSAMKLISRQVELRREDFQSGMNEQNMPRRTHGGGIRTP